MADRFARLLLPRPWAVLSGLILFGSMVAMLPEAAGSDLRQTPIVKAVQRAGPSVVNIRGEKTIAAQAVSIAGDDVARRVNGMGTGVVIDERGYIITNHHVVDGGREIVVTTLDGEQYTAKLISRDPETDLAIIKVEPRRPLPVICVGTSADLMPGEPVVAVGNAYGYENTATRGIISALHRPVRVSDAQFYEDLIQTDASINPGNSGGPLLNVDGEMIGINVAVRAGAQGIGFAIPADKAIAVAAELLASCAASNHWHGLAVATDREETEPRLVVTSVEKGSPGAEAGLEAGDVIISLDGEEIRQVLDFHRAVLELAAGDQIELSVRRDEESFTAELTLGEPRVEARSRGGIAWDLFGLELKPIPSDEFRRRFQTRYRGGLAVTAVRPNSPADLRGIRQGDVLVGMHIWETVSLENVAYVVNRPDFAALNPVRFWILRGSQTLYGYLPITMKAASQR